MVSSDAAPANPVPETVFRTAADYIESVQCADGSIPWFEGGPTDPWDHVEAAMGLSVAGRMAAAERAYRWLCREQLADGSWWAAYRNGRPEPDNRRETNFVAYVATGLWHHYLITRDRAFLQRMWPVLQAAIGYVVGHQDETGAVSWAVDRAGVAADEALVTGCSSIYKSLECALHIAAVLGVGRPDWLLARARLGRALRTRPGRFDQTKRRYAMDWFYPVLAGVVGGAAARSRLAERWAVFVEPGLGCRCVADRPWVTVAESCELVLSLLAAGAVGAARTLFAWLHQYDDGTGAYWTGYAYRERMLWPEERPTWTAGAVLLAADALARRTPAWRLFTAVSVRDAAEHAERLNQAFVVEQA